MRLIDRDYLYNKLVANKCSYDLVLQMIKDKPTVDVLDKIRAEIEQLHYHPKLDFIKSDEVVDMALYIIDKYKAESEDKE